MVYSEELNMNSGSCPNSLNNGLFSRMSAGRAEDRTQNSGSGSGGRKSDDRKSKRSEKDRKSRKSSKSKKSHKSTSKGLEPPKSNRNTEKEKDSTHHEKENSTQTSQHSGRAAGTFDVTQWENSRFIVEKGTPKNQDEQHAGPQDGNLVGEGPVLGEHRQEMLVRGQHLKKKPKPTIIMLLFELLLGVASVMVWLIGAENPTVPQAFAATNFFAILIAVVFSLAVETLRIHVSHVEETNCEKYFVPYSWRYLLAVSNVLRLTLVFCNIIILSLDNDFDAGSIVALTAQPISLILVSCQLPSSFRRKDKQ